MEVSRIGQRATILRGIREFFWARDFLEVGTPIVLPYPSQEPHLEPLRTTVHDHRSKAHDGFLRMSPEFSLKKLLAILGAVERDMGTVTKPVTLNGNVERDVTVTSSRNGHRSLHRYPFPCVFEIGPVFRDGEPWGGSHNPEFTLLEWYRLGATYRDLMSDCEALVLRCASVFHVSQRRGMANGKWQMDNYPLAIGNSPFTLTYQNQSIDLTTPWERLTMCEAWKRHAHLDLDALLGTRGKHRVLTKKHPMLRSARSALARVCVKRGYTVTRDDTFDDLFFKIHLTEVEPKLGRSRPTFLTDWPTQMAALARRKQNNPRYAERVELYIGGLEIANGFSELTDVDEQLARFRADQRLRRKLGKLVYPIDEDFIAALRCLPPCAGMALGVDRLVMLLVDAKTIDEVRWLPTHQLFR